MNRFGTYAYAYFKYLLLKDMDVLISFFRKKGICIGENCFIYSAICTPEPYLIIIKNNVTISVGVQLITHDNSVCKVLPNRTDAFGRIVIGNNSFIGAGSIILPGVTIGDNCIVAAGSIVTKSLGNNVVIGGNPAKIISTIDEYKDKISDKSFNVNGMTFVQKRNHILSSLDKLIQK